MVYPPYRCYEVDDTVEGATTMAEYSFLLGLYAQRRSPKNWNVISSGSLHVIFADTAGQHIYKVSILDSRV